MTIPTVSQAVVEATELPTWNDVVRRSFGDIAVEAPARGFRASIRHHRWGGIAMSTVDSTPARVDGCMRTERSDGSAAGCFLLLNVLGHSTVSQAGRDAVLGPGDLTAVRQGETYRIDFDESNRMQVLAIPELDGRSALDEHVARCHPHREAPLLGGFIAQLATINGASAPTLDGQVGVRLVLDLLALSWPGLRDDLTDRHPLAAWEPRVRELVDRELGDPDLDAHALGRALGISARYVQMIFARQGTTFTAYVRERRLQLAAQRLREPGQVHIGKLALDVGFNDISNFCRCFRIRFGCSARRWRIQDSTISGPVRSGSNLLR